MLLFYERDKSEDKMIYGPLAPTVGGRWQMPIDIPLPAASKLPLHTWIGQHIYMYVPFLI